MRREPYIVNGQVVRGDSSFVGVRRHSWQYLSWKRVWLVLIATALLAATNPANWQDTRFEPRYKHRKSSAYSRTQSFVARSVTNYLLFSVEEKFEAVVISALQQSWRCYYDDVKIGNVCDMIASNLSHQKPLLWDKRDRAYTAHRILCLLLLCSALASYCCPGAPIGKLFDNPYLDGLASVFYRPNLIADILYANLSVYPALVEMNRVIPRLHKGSIFSTGDTTYDFVLATILLVLFIGGGCNLFASRVTNTKVRGFSSVIAASLGYYQLITLARKPILFTLSGQPVTAAGAYWTSVALLVVQNSRHHGWFPPLVAWLAAGWAGSMFAKYHLENMRFFGDLFKLFGLA